jgi:hypothetical protein
MKKVVFLIISSHDSPVYGPMREISRQYFQKMQSVFQYHYFFLEHRGQEQEIEIEGDMMYAKGTEHYYGILDKTQKAFRHINRHLHYDMVIRTNLSSLWNFFALYDFLDNLYDKGIATGICDSICMSGTGIMLSQDVCKTLCDTMIYDESMTDDVILRRNLERFMTVQPAPFTIRCDLIYGPHNVLPPNLQSFVYFRVKNELNRMEYDIPLFKYLVKELYNIDVAPEQV